jgi:hypothetical protein
MRATATILACCAMGLTGCAVRMEGAENNKPIAVGATATKKLTSAFQEGCKEEATTAGLQIEFQQGAARSTGEPGALLAMYVNDFRYISTGMRIGIGIMSGNAFIDANTKFLDLQTGAVWGERPYMTKSSAMEGIGSAMTAKQAQAICKNMIDVVRGTDGGAAKK